ncbi:MAG: AAA family ATPase [Ktedonobacteraceae bacterium]
MVTSPLQQAPSPALEQVMAHLKGVRTSLRGWKACCPAHADQQPSLSIGLGEQGQVLLKCFAGCSLERIVEAMGLTIADLFPAATSTQQGQGTVSGHAPHPMLTLLDLALEKQLPWQFLCHLGVMELPSAGLQIPYHLPDGTLAPRYRIRTALAAREGSRWNKGEGKIVPYGLERLEEARQAGYLVLVEGESDCWTLWYQGFPALGLPGAEMAGTLEESALAGIDRLYIVQEPDAAGATLVKALRERLAAWQWQGRAMVIRLPRAKDPNELYTQDRKGFHAAFQHALDQAEPLALSASQPTSLTSEHKPGIFSLRELLSWQLPPVRWAVPEILPEGLTLLAGKPKQGKSWLALSVALSIAAGGVALGAQPVTQGDVLYLALEDNARRLQARARQLLESMTGVPGGVDFALEWPRLGEGGLSALEDYLKGHPHVRLVVIDTWAKVAPPSGEHRSTQYAGDYEALTPLKHLADTYHVSVLAVHHLRKTGSSDVLDEITGSTGMTGAIDGALILKRERGQMDATLFVTGRDIEREQHLALTFDPSTAQWTLVGKSDEVGRTRARQQILDLLREQQPAGMSPRDIAEALEKNYHTTRSILRKMEETGEIKRLQGRYIAISADAGQGHMRQVNGIEQKELVERQQSTCLAPPDNDSPDDNVGTAQSDDTDDVDYSDYADDGNDASAGSFTEEQLLNDAVVAQETVKLITVSKDGAMVQQERNQQETAVISVINVINRNQCHQTPASFPSMEVQDMLPGEADIASRAEQNEAALQKKRCPHHPQARMVRFDPAGQAWCDKMDCWDCYRLMKIGEALGYCCVIDQGGHPLINQGLEAWSAFVLSQRPFMVMSATQQAIVTYKTQGVEVPDLSGEVQHLVEVPPTPS